jgi:hypothetical protein
VLSCNKEALDLTDNLDRGDREIIALGRPDPVLAEAV